MGLFDVVGGLLGGGKKGGSPSQVVDTTPDEFAGLRGGIADQLRTLFGGGVSGVPTPSGPMVAPITGQEQNFLGMIGQQAGGGPLNATRDSLLQRTLSGTFLSPDSNPFLQATIEAAQRPLVQQFQEQTIPQLRSQFTAAGQMIQPGGSSPFDMAAARAQGGLSDALGDVSTNIAGQNFQAERGRQQQAVTQAMQVQQSDLDNLIRGLQASALPRSINQLGIDKGVQSFDKQISTLLQALSLATGASTGGNVMLPGAADQTGSNMAGLGKLLEGGSALFRANPFAAFG